MKAAGPTSLRSLRELRLGKPVPQTQSEASEGCLAAAYRVKADRCRAGSIGDSAGLHRHGNACAVHCRTCGVR